VEFLESRLENLTVQMDPYRRCILLLFFFPILLVAEDTLRVLVYSCIFMCRLPVQPYLITQPSNCIKNRMKRGRAAPENLCPLRSNNDAHAPSTNVARLLLILQTLFLSSSYDLSTSQASISFSPDHLGWCYSYLRKNKPVFVAHHTFRVLHKE
jgi:hypothetical protein